MAKRKKTIQKATEKVKLSKNAKLNVEHPRGTNTYTFGFSGVRKLEKKEELFNQKADKEIEKGIKRKGAKPPKGYVVILKGKEKLKAEVVTDKAVNVKNVKQSVSNLIDDSINDFDSLLTDDGSEGSDENLNPDSISEITIKYIY